MVYQLQQWPKALSTQIKLFLLYLQIIYSVLTGNKKQAFSKDLEVTNLSAALFYYLKQYLPMFNFWPWSTWLVHQKTWQEDCSPAPKQWQDAFSGLQKDSQSSYWHMSANRGLSIFPLPRENTMMHHLNLLAQKKSLFTDFPGECKLAHDFASPFLHQRLFPSNVPKVDLEHLLGSVGLNSLPSPILTQTLLLSDVTCLRTDALPVKMERQSVLL